MEKNINIEKIVEELSSIDNYTKKIEWLKKNIKSEKYVPWNTKVAIAKKIVEATSYKVEKNSEGNYVTTNNIEIDSNNRFVLFALKIIQYWTNIELTENISEDFDNLNRLEVINILLDVENNIIPERELVEFNTIIKACYDDFMTNKYENHAYISNQVTRVTDLLGVILQPLVNKLIGMDDEELERNIDKFNKAASKISKIYNH